MRFMCLVVLDSDLAAQMSPADWAEMGRISQDHDNGLMARGILVAAEALQGAETARTVRVRQGDAMITDGPFAESKELFAGFILIEVPDMETAMQVARAIPMARLGAVEVRPVMRFA